jgi:hypothetical protein
MSSWKQFLGTVWHHGWPVLVVIAFSLAYAQPGRGASASVYVLAPKPHNPLNSIETHGATPVFKKDFSIPYDAVEPLIRDEIKKKVDGPKEGTVPCPTDFCPDLHWRVTVKSGFVFTDKSQQPVITAFYDPQQQTSGVDITLHTSVQINFDVNETIWYETIVGEESGSKESPIAIPIDIDASARLNLWPILQSQDFAFHLTPDTYNVGGGNINLPLYPSDVLDQAENEVIAEINKRLADLLNTVNEQVLAEARKDISPAEFPSYLKDQLLNTKLPAVDKSYQELSDPFGLTLDVQTTTTGNVNVVATLRFSGGRG